MVKTLSLEDAAKRFEKAEAILKRIPFDQTDSAYNLAAGLDNFAGSSAAADVQMVDGINDVLERLDRIETLLKSLAARRP
jgi:hypothetical protein